MLRRVDPPVDHQLHGARAAAAEGAGRAQDDAARVPGGHVAQTHVTRVTYHLADPVRVQHSVRHP